MTPSDAVPPPRPPSTPPESGHGHGRGNPGGPGGRRRGRRRRGDSGPALGSGHQHGHGHGHGHHGHSHGHGPAAPVSDRLRKVIAAVLIPFAAAVLTGLVVLWPGDASSHRPSGLGPDRHTEAGRVVKLEEVACAGSGG
ncbi:YibE/F family protein, partial [Streptomyces sp. URMC 126]